MAQPQAGNASASPTVYPFCLGCHLLASTGVLVSWDDSISAPPQSPPTPQFWLGLCCWICCRWLSICMRREPISVPIGLGTPQRQRHVRGTTGLGVGPGLGAKKCLVEAGLGFCGLRPLLKTVRGSGNDANESPRFALSPLRRPRGQGAQMGLGGMHLFSSQGRGSISRVAWGAAGGPSCEMGLLALLLASGQVGAAGQHLGQRLMCGQWGWREKGGI